MSLTKHFAAFFEAWKAEDVRRKQQKKQHIDTDFLPAALEIAEKPPSPIGRAILWLIAGTTAIALIWSVIGKVDVVAVGEGKIAPIGRLQNIEAAAAGTVREILVKEGAKVQEGQDLLTLDPTFAQADVGAAIAEFNQSNLASARARALLDYIAGKPAIIVAPPEASIEAINSEQESVHARIMALEEKLASFEAQEQAAISAIGGAKVQMARASATLPIAREQLNARLELDRAGYGARLITLQAQERVVSLEYEVKLQNQEIAKAQSDLANIKRQKEQARQEFKAQAAAELAEAKSISASRVETATKAKERASQQILKAPMNGTIVAIDVTTIGEQVEVGKPLITMIPEGQELRVEAIMLNKDIGFIRENQKAIVKLDAYPFTRYGYLDGFVETISADSIKDEKLGLVFPFKVKLNSLEMVKGKNSKTVHITPGMSVKVEIITNKRRLIDFILSPIMRATQEAGREQ